MHWAMEIVVVMIGVLLALGVQQWAETRTARNRAAEAEERIRQELLTNGILLIERVATFQCFAQRLVALKTGVVEGGPEWRPAGAVRSQIGSVAFPKAYAVPLRTYGNDAFRSVGNSGDLAAVPPERLSNISQLYSTMTLMTETSGEEFRRALELSPLTLVGSGDAGKRADYLGILVKLDASNALSRVLAEQTVPEIAALGYRLTPDDMKGWAGSLWHYVMVEGRAFHGTCFDARGAQSLFRRLAPTTVAPRR